MKFGHCTGTKHECNWQNPPVDYLAKEEARIQAIELEWQQREHDAAQAAQARTDEADAQAWYTAEQAPCRAQITAQQAQWETEKAEALAAQRAREAKARQWRREELPHFLQNVPA